MGTESIGAACGGVVGTESIKEACGGVVGTESIKEACGGVVGTESIKDACGGVVGTESIKEACGGVVGTESIKEACGGVVGTESVSAKAELATAQPATKAIKLNFIMISPIDLLTSTTNWGHQTRRPSVVTATPRGKFPHVGTTLYA